MGLAARRRYVHFAIGTHRCAPAVVVSVVLAVAVIALVEVSARAGDDEQASSWEGYRNRLLPERRPHVVQDFGYSRTAHAGCQAGEVGGRVQRSLKAARYGKRLTRELTLDDRLDASGKLAVTHTEGGSGALVGWYHTTSRGWRTPNSLAFRVDGNANTYWMFYEYGTAHGRTGGGGAFEGERYQTTPTPPFPADETVHEWSLSYDPDGGDGNGSVTFRIDEREYNLALRAEDRADGAVFDHFGIWNQETTGGEVVFWLDDLVVNGEAWDFADDPGWDAVGNRADFIEPVVRPYHNFGHVDAANGGGESGAIGGIIFRDEAPAYYGHLVGPLSLDVPLRASGTITLRAAGADSAVYIGWFDSKTKRAKVTPEYDERQRNYLAVLVEGPSRVGHYFRAGYSTCDGSGRNDSQGPVLPADGSLHRWSIEYDPAAADGRGEITTTLDDTRQTMTLEPGDRERGATFDRFGLFNMQSGGWHVEAYVDDLEFTTRPTTSAK